tara:strand:+ start:595 stop:1119 length:525 start_codon:yes stop_codon:yes gene_type:complete
MKSLFFLIIFFFFSQNVQAVNKTVYIDIQYIIDNSKLGKFYKSKIKIIQDKNDLELTTTEKKIKKKENEINNQKNILSEEELNNKLKEINVMFTEYQKKRRKLKLDLSDQKKNYSKKILKILNPLLTNYVDKNSIELVIEKKNIVVGSKTLDITNSILEILNKETENKNLMKDE